MVDKQEKRNQERLKRREEREKEEKMKQRWVHPFKLPSLAFMFIPWIECCNIETFVNLFHRTRSRSREHKR